MEQMLNDTNTYQRLARNQDEKIINKIIKFTNEHKELLTSNEIKYLTKFDYKTSQFYGLPKIHKSIIINEQFQIRKF